MYLSRKNKESVFCSTCDVLLLFLIFLCFACGNQDGRIRTQVAEHPRTFCNPLNLDYRFMKSKKWAGIREAADPVVVEFKGKFILFASKSSGYWITEDFTAWKHIIIPPDVLPIEDYAPGIYIREDSLYYAGSTRGTAKVYRTADPESGKWDCCGEMWLTGDPSYHIEGDRLFLYHGCSPRSPIIMQEFDATTLQKVGDKVVCLNSDTGKHGWERLGHRNDDMSHRPWIEGSWMTEHNGRYYLQYAAPGTQFDSYADGAYISDAPTGPFEYCENSPVSHKPTGFITGAGHGCVFKVGENYWKAATNAISVRHMFERRISFFPAGFDRTASMYTDTYLGDYPMFLPSAGERKEVRPDWMLLSFRKPVRTSSLLAGRAGDLVDEKCRTAWVAESNSDREWVEIDLCHLSTVHAIQVNYDEYGITSVGYHPEFYQSYVLYASRDGSRWSMIVDKSAKRTDTPHDYMEFSQPFEARYIRWENRGYNLSENVSLRELRVFGKTEGEKPGPANLVGIHRSEEDPCCLNIVWEPSENAIGYIIREGVDKDNLFHSYQVVDSTHYEMRGLNSGTGYYIAVDAYNESGVTPGKIMEVR